MTKTAEGVAWVSRVTLRPQISSRATQQPTADELARLHHAAHHDCFIANSVKTEIVVAVGLRARSREPARGRRATS